MRFLLIISIATLLISCSEFKIGADLDLRWQSCAGTVQLTIEPDIETNKIVERAIVTCDGIEMAQAFCVEGNLGLEYHTLPGNRIGVIVLCNGKPMLSVDGTL